MAEITITGTVPHHPRQRVVLVEQAAKAISQSVGEDPFDAVMSLLVAAVHITKTHSDAPASDIAEAMARALGHAIAAAEDFFKAETVQ